MKCKNPIRCLTRQETIVILICGVLIGISLVAAAYGNYYRPYSEIWIRIQELTSYPNYPFLKILLTVPVAIYSIAIPLSLKTLTDAASISTGDSVKNILLNNLFLKRLKWIPPIVIAYIIICLFFHIHSGFPVFVATVMVVFIVYWFFRYVQFLFKLSKDPRQLTLDQAINDLNSFFDNDAKKRRDL